MKRFGILALFISLALRPAAAEPEKSARYSTPIQGVPVPILKSYGKWARKLDRNRDNSLSLEELARGIRDLPARLAIDLDDFAVGLRHELTGTASEYAPAYPTLQQVQDQLREWAKEFPDRAELSTLATTQEGHELLLLRLHGPPGSPKVLIVANQHAREWVSSQVALETVRRFLQRPAEAPPLELLVVAMANPDGYEYSHESNPMWRKNRSTEHGEVVGVDLNRNFSAPFRYKGDRPDETRDDRGASDDPDSPQYRGPEALSEPETRAIHQLLDEPGLAGVLDLHTFGCKVVIPNQPVVDESVYQTLGRKLVDVMGEPYEVVRYKDLYDISGYLAGEADARGIPGLTLEFGRAFQPDPSKVPGVVSVGADGVNAFLDSVKG